MAHIVFALVRGFASLSRPGLWRYLVLPPLIAGGLWLFATFLWLGTLIDWLLADTPLAWVGATLGDWHLGWIASVFAFVGAWVILLAGAYLVAVAMAGMWALPGIARLVAEGEYPDVAARGTDSVLLSVGVTLRAMLGYLLGWVATLPVWIVPGAAVLHSLFWLAYLNRATFAYDAVAAHATRAEWAHLRREHAGRLWSLGLLAAVLAHVPLLGLFAPSLGAMVFVHYELTALRNARDGGGVDRPGVIDGEFRRE